ncbi:AAA family ATPase [Clostridium botulinum]|uniref:Endonuclease GajA/Old nuclease/RecF-like AAA domain-containing protein n=1 Tax=Clostridium botulinum TaxID=1491 RepID=A0A6G4EBZ1_CLOBO|nr:AAA family ATPase [Clostridium botulinum]APH20084.1 AAA domain protein [Clostridium botulinum]NFB13628.1 hypothetical protein [Clostridium botulinum]NFH56895.1 hypothetical protein [Clostridium botulinum]NFH60705.1 hypothetical protein [Clostridium botulinum]NFJ85032.1 hypothetical protein [Clostridium botulinum]
MELLYIWIGNYKDIFKKQEFNFGRKEVFKYDKKNKIINITYENNYFDKFFGGNIINITALVGENGSGKSTILDIIKNFFNNPSSLVEYGFVFVFKCNEEYNIYYTKDLVLKVKDNGMEKNLNDFFTEHCEIDKYMCFDEIDLLYKSHKVYFSNVFSGRIIDKNSEIGITDEKNIPRKNDYIHNITTDRLMMVNKYEYNYILFDVNIFESTEIIKQIEFLFSKEYSYIKGKLRNLKEINCLKIEIDDTFFDIKEDINQLTTCGKNKKITYFNYNQILPIQMIKDRFYELMNEELEYNKTGKRFRIQFLKNLMIYYFNNVSNVDLEFAINNNKRSILNFSNKLDVDIKSWTYTNLYKNIENFFLEWSKVLKENIIYMKKKSFENKDQEFINRYKNKEIEKINNFKKLIKEAEKMESIIKEAEKNNTEDYNYFININVKENKEKIIDFIKVFYKTIIYKRFLRFNYIDSNRIDNYELSSGEMAYLTMFSRFYKILNEIKEVSKNEKHKDKIKNILILMDEPELYMHPNWQRLFIQNSIYFFQELFKGYNLQIILTSNTPFLASDLPKENIIFFKNKDGQCKICDNDNLQQTFGSNIHTLLTNSFFMDNTIGEFANQKIKAVARDLTEKSKEDILNIDGRKEEIEYIIKNIGEPVIKRKLQDMYKNKFSKEIEHYELQIQKLKKEKAELETKLKDNELHDIDSVMKLLDEKIRELKEKVGDKV